LAELSADVIKRYVADVIAAEKSFEAQLQRFAKDADNETTKTVFNQYARETRQQHERLTDRLHSLEGIVPTPRGFLAFIFGLSLKSPQIGAEKEGRTTQELMMAYAVTNSELATYECLATMAEAAGDAETAQLARTIQSQKGAMAQEIWNLLPASALDVYKRVTGSRSVKTTA
jgi:ferritin-like metal-binding protein YciE